MKAVINLAQWRREHAPRPQQQPLWLQIHFLGLSFAERWLLAWVELVRAARGGR